MMLLFALFAAATLSAVDALENGLARTPPLGWLSWQRYRCDIDCFDNELRKPGDDDRQCFNEALIQDIADAMDSHGYRQAGYQYVNLDDCWQAPKRVNGHVVADPKRFPSGIKALAAYVHGKGLKLGLYTAMGNQTCAASTYAIDGVGLGCDYTELQKGCKGAKRDIDDYASWDIDHLKVDGCGGFDQVQQNASYALVGEFLAAAAKKRVNKSIVYHPSNLGFRYPRQFRELGAIANQWRWFNDVQDSWSSVTGIIAEIGAGQPKCIAGPLPKNCTSFDGGGPLATYCSSHCSEVEQFLAVPRPGAWHDPDMLITGNTPCSSTEQKNGMHCNTLTHDEELTQFIVWSMASAPLFMSNDLARVPEASKAILQNNEILSIDQDVLGRMCRRFALYEDGTQMWKKELDGGDVAVALVNLSNESRAMTVTFSDVGWAPDTRVSLRDLVEGVDLGWKVGSYKSTAMPAHGSMLLRLSFKPQLDKEL